MDKGGVRLLIVGWDTRRVERRMFLGRDGVFGEPFVSKPRAFLSGGLACCFVRRDVGVMIGEAVGNPNLG